jgi:hypothetical protein
MVQDTHVRLNQRLSWQKQHQQQQDSFHRQIEFKFRAEVSKCYIWSITLCGAETGDTSESRPEILENFEMWLGRMMEKIGWTDRVKNEVLHKVRGERNIVHTIKRRKDDWDGQI